MESVIKKWEFKDVDHERSQLNLFFQKFNDGVGRAGVGVDCDVIRRWSEVLEWGGEHARAKKVCAKFACSIFEQVG